jgi:hypothetical protein
MGLHPQISKQTFWDVEISDLDFEESHDWIILRVFDRGTLGEVFSIINYYGFDTVKNVLVSTTENLPTHAVLLAKAIFNLNYSDFKCSGKKSFQLN